MNDPPRPGARRRELAREQQHVDRVHARVDVLRAQAQRRRAAAEADRSSSTFQARYERDVTAFHHARRAVRFTFGDEEPLVFGRLDTVGGDTFHIGRVSVIDHVGSSLLVDWRAAAAAPFYRATAAEPAGVARRRTLSVRGADVRDLDDEVLDADAADRLGLESVTGQGALLAALTRSRSHRMRDIVATIQADQDRIIRLPATGTVVVTGGPGTGKTVVALHRVAYLLYANRHRFEHRGVLVVGPSEVFTRYIGRVLPSLGEERAVLRSVADIAAHPLTIRGWDPPDVAAVKGDLSMVEVCRRAVRASLPALTSAARFTVAGTTATLRPHDLERVRDRLWRRTAPVDADWRGGYLGRRAEVEDAVLAAAWTAWKRQRRADRRPVPADREEVGFDWTLRGAEETDAVVDRVWPPVRAVDVLDSLTTGRLDLHDLAGDLLGPDDVERLRRVWGPHADGTHTVEDVAVFDEIDHLVGRPPRPVDRDDEGIRLAIERAAPAVDLPAVDHDDYRDFAHVVVDEAQDLAPMQWRMVARRGPHASWTVVGDLAQRSRVTAPDTWEDITALIGRRQVRIERLTINYRTPTEIVDVARAVLRDGGRDDAIVPTAVRSGGRRPALRRADDVAAAAVDVALEDALTGDGTVGVVAPVPLLPRLRARLEDALHEHTDPVRVDLADRVRLFDPRTVKGLEFDAVVVADAHTIAAEPDVGTHLLYVAVTRATASLALIAPPAASVPGSGATDDAPAAA